MPTNLVLGVNTMNCDAITKSAHASQAPEDRALRARVTNVTLAHNGQSSVRGLSLATLAAALAACGGGGSGGPAAPPTPPPPPPPNNAPTGTDATGTAVEDGDPATGGAVGSDSDGDALTYSVSTQGTLGTLALADDGAWTYTITDSDQIQALGASDTLSDEAEITISDGEASATAKVTITIQGANDNPTAEDGMGAVMAGTDMAAMGNVNAADVDSGDTRTFAVTADAMYGDLAVDAMGAWTYMLDHDNAAVRALGHGETMSDTATITVSDSAGGSADVTVTVTITGIVEAPDVSAAAGVAENDTSGPNIAQVTSPDSGTTFSVDHDDFEIEMVGSTAVLKLKDGASLDHESTSGSVTVNVTATDGAGNASAATAVMIAVSDVNEAPEISVMDGTTPDGMVASSTVAENATGALAGAVAISDVDGDDLTLSVDDERFETKQDDAGGWWLKLKDDVSLNHEAADTITVNVTVSDGTLSTSQAVAITVADVNEAPTVEVKDGTTPDGMPARAVISENATGVVGAIAISDVDDGDMLTVSVPEDSGFSVSQDAEGGWWLELSSPVDYEASATATVTVTVSDGELNGTHEVTVQVTDEDEDPTIMVTDVSAAAEDTPNQVVGTIVVGDVDAKDSLGAGNVTVDDDRFSVRANADGSISLVLTQAIDADTLDTNPVSVTVTVTDTGGNDASATVNVLISGENEAPVISMGDGVTPGGDAAVSTVGENMMGVPVAQIDASDPEDGLLNHGSLMIVDADGNPVTNGPFMIAADPRDGVSWLMLSEAQDFEMDGGTLSVTVRVTDADGVYADATHTITISDVNEAPTVDASGSGAVTASAEMPMPVTGNLNAGDQDAGQTLTVAVEGDDYGTLEVNADGSWTYTLNEESEAVQMLGDGDTLNEIITVTFTDDDGTPMSAESTVTIAITGVNDPATLEVKDSFIGSDPANSIIKENEVRPVGEVVITDAENALDQDDITLSDPVNFELETDAEGRIWLKLVNAFDYEGLDIEPEADGSKHVQVQLRITDGDHDIMPTMYVIKVQDDNDPPTATDAAMDGDADNPMPVLLEIERNADDSAKDERKKHSEFEVVAGVEGIDIELDLDAMFMDQDDDQNFRYHLENAPTWLRLESTNPEDGETRWTLEGTPPAAKDEPLVTTVKLVATDQRDGEGEIEFDIIWEDGNDEPYDLIVRNGPDEDDEEIYETDEPIPENMDGLGTGLFVSYKDDDNPDHRFGKVTLTVDNDKFEVDPMTGEIKLKAGQSLNYESDMDVDMDGVPDSVESIDLTITAKDGGVMSEITQTVVVTVSNQNDPVTKGVAPGRWWVTVDEDLDADDVEPGDWLKFFIEEPGDDLPLFRDDDGAADLTYTLKDSPAWLEIDGTTGEIQNVEKMLPTRGVHEVTVVATDKGGIEVEQTFTLTVAFSDDNDADNDDPKIVNERGKDVDENSPSDTVLATFTVEDDDWELLKDGGYHPYAPKMPSITIVTPTLDSTDGTPWTLAQIRARLKIEIDPMGDADDDSQDYQIVPVGTSWLDHEMLDELTITIAVTDGVITIPVTDTIEVDIDDVNEAPVFAAESGRSTGDGGTIAREQQEDAVDTIYLNLTRLFEDREDGADDRDELTFSGLSGLPSWMTTLHGGIQTWEDIKEATEDATTPVTDATWTAGTAPDDDDYVLILRVDRTATTGTDGQDSVGMGSFTVTVTDSNSLSSMYSFMFTVSDENVDPTGADGSGVTFAANAREGQSVRVNFNEAVDPDFDGDAEPVVVLYQVLTAGGEVGDPDTVVVQVSLAPESYRVQQSDVGGTLSGQVIYFELDAGTVKSIVRSPVDAPQLSKDSTAVTNVHDRGEATFTFSTTETAGEIQVTAMVIDEDVGDADENYAVTLVGTNYQWQVSDTGRGNWEDFGDGGNTEAITAEQSGKYVRVVVTYDGEHGDGTRMETVRSDAIKVGSVDQIVPVDITAPTASALVGSNAAIGSTLMLDATETDGDPVEVDGNDVVQWYAQVGTDTSDPTIRMPVGDGGSTFTVTQAHQGLTIFAEVRKLDANGGLASVDLSGTVTVEGTRPGNVAPTAKAMPMAFELDGTVPDKAGTLELLKSGMIDVNEFFEDFNRDDLTFTLGAVENFGDEVEIGEDLTAYLSGVDAANGNGLLIIDYDSETEEVEVWYHTTQSHSHDGDGADGGGNMISLPFTADDGNGGTTDLVNVNLHIDVAATGIENAAAVTTPFAIAFEVQENAAAGAAAGTINILDENLPTHDYGKYDWANAVVSDDRFEVVPVDADADGVVDGSQATFKLKAGATLPNVNAVTPVTVTVTVNPMGAIEDAVTIMVTVNIQNTDGLTGPPTPAAIPATNIPGLKDDETTDPDDETEDDTTDDDDDGGAAPLPADAASLAMLDDGLF